MSPEPLFALAIEVRRALREADRLKLSVTAIHLDQALLSLASLDPTGTIGIEPFSPD